MGKHIPFQISTQTGQHSLNINLSKLLEHTFKNLAIVYPSSPKPSLPVIRVTRRANGPTTVSHLLITLTLRHPVRLLNFKIRILMIAWKFRSDIYDGTHRKTPMLQEERQGLVSVFNDYKSD